MKIVIGVPSRNEAATIERVLTSIDDWIVAAGLGSESLIVSAECSSVDQTRDLVDGLSLRSKLESYTVEVGKGYAIRKIFEVGQAEQASAIVLVDSDVNHIHGEWLDRFLACFRLGYEMIHPRRRVAWNGGDLSYYLSTPLLAAFGNALMYEPICGDVLVSASVVDACLKKPWTASVNAFGIDVFLSWVGREFRWTECFMKMEKGNPHRAYEVGVLDQKRYPGNKFRDVFTTAVNLCAEEASFLGSQNLTVESVVGVRLWPIEIVTPDRTVEELKIALGLAKPRLLDLSKQLSDPWVEVLAPHVQTIERGLAPSDWNRLLFQAVEHARMIEGDERIALIYEQLLLSRTIWTYNQFLGDSEWYEDVVAQSRKMSLGCC